MKQKTWRNLLILSLLIFLITACNSNSTEPETEVLAAERSAVPVEVGVVTTGNIASVLTYAGDLQPTDSINLTSVVAGAVEEIMVDVGDTVQAADPLMRVEDTIYKAQLKQAQANLTIAQANLQKMENGAREEQIELAKTGLLVAQTNLQKMENGARDEQIAMAQAGVDAARAQLYGITTLTEDERTLASANLAQAEASLRLAQFEYDKIKWAGQTGQTPQALQLQQATIAYETALAAYNMQANPDQSTLDQINAGVRQAQSNLQMTLNPFTEEDFILAQANVRQAELNLAMAENPFTDEDLAMVRANIAQAESLVSQAQFQVENTVLRAPFDGVVAEVYVTVGSGASPASPALKIISHDLEVLIDIPSAEIAKVYQNQAAALKSPSYGDEDFPAFVSNIAPAADTSSHTFPVKIIPYDKSGKLKSGMFANISILVEEKTDVVLIPRSALTIINGQDIVYVVSKDEATDRDIVTMRPVTTGLSDATRIEITDGLNPDETIVLAGLNNLSDGTIIQIVTLSE